MKTAVTFEDLPELTSQLLERIERLQELILAQLNIKRNEVPDYLDVNEACEFLKISKSTLYNKCSKGEIPRIKAHKRLLFKRSDLIDLLNEHRLDTIQKQESIAARQVDALFSKRKK